MCTWLHCVVRIPARLRRRAFCKAEFRGASKGLEITGVCVCACACVFCESYSCFHKSIILNLFILNICFHSSSRWALFLLKWWWWWNNTSLFCVCSWYLPCVSLWGDTRQTFVPPMCLHWQYQIYPPGMVGFFLQSAASSDYYNSSQNKPNTVWMCSLPCVNSECWSKAVLLDSWTVSISLSLIYFCQCHIKAG